MNFRHLVAAALSFVSLFASKNVQATADLDRRYALESVGYLKPWDNVDGIFADSVEEAYHSYFKSQSRFRLMDLGKAQEVLSSSKISYRKLIEDEDVLARLAKAGKVESIIRSRVQKEGQIYRVRLEWFLFPSRAILSQVDFDWTPPVTEDSSKGWKTFVPAFEAGLSKLVSLVPFRGHITGRDGKEVTLNIGKQAGIGRGDILVIETISDAKIHPKLHTVVGWNLEPIGRLKVTQVDDSISFATIIEEDAERPISRYQKITRVLKAKNERLTIIDENEEESGESEDGEVIEGKKEWIPRIGYVSFGPWLGSVHRDYTPDGQTGKEGSAFFFGGRADSEIWLTSSLFANVGLGGAFFNYSQKDKVTGQETAAQSVGGSLTTLQLMMGYRHHFQGGNLQAPSGFVRGGYRMNSYSLPSSVSESTGSSTYHSGMLGIGADLPVRELFDLHMAFDLGILNSLSEQIVAGQELRAVTGIDVSVAASRMLAPDLGVRAGFEFSYNGANIGPPSSTQGSVSGRTFSFLPALVYFF